MTVPIHLMPCDDCGRMTTMDRMPEDWPADWWTHSLEGKRCPVPIRSSIFRNLAERKH